MQSEGARKKSLSTKESYAALVRAGEQISQKTHAAALNAVEREASSETMAYEKSASSVMGQEPRSKACAPLVMALVLSEKKMFQRSTYPED